jgi:Protein of unknown function (DUF3037)
MSDPATARQAAAAVAAVDAPELRAQDNFQYVVIRVVPRVEREEFVNAGVVVFCRTRSFLQARVELNVKLLTALAPEADSDSIQAQLDAYVRIAAGDPGAGPIARLSQSERYHWLSAPSSTVVQTSPGHSGICVDPAQTLEDLFVKLVA